MKANRRFVNNDEAVSPVIAVILMVAITVVLAATVFVLVSDIGSKSGKGVPSFEFSIDETANQLKVTGHSGGADWNRLEMKADQAFEYALNTDSEGNGTAVAANTWKLIAASTDAMQPSDYLDLCSGTTGASNVKFDLRDGNQLVKEGILFSSLGAC